MIWKRKLLTGEALRERAEELGVSVKWSEKAGSLIPDAPEYEVQRRVIEAERHLRDSRLWMVAVFSALFALASAAAAWWAVLHPSPKVDCPQSSLAGKETKK